MSTNAMSTYPLKKLLELWRLEELTAEQLLGYLLQQVIQLEQRLAQLEKLAPPRS